MNILVVFGCLPIFAFLDIDWEKRWLLGKESHIPSIVRDLGVPPVHASPRRQAGPRRDRHQTGQFVLEIVKINVRQLRILIIQRTHVAIAREDDETSRKIIKDIVER